MHYVWVGGDEAGLSVTFDSDQNWQTRKYVEVVETKGTRTIRFTLIGSDYVLAEPLDYTVALHATPVKPLPKEPRKWRYGWSGAQTPPAPEQMEIACQYGLTRGCGWPGLTAKGKAAHVGIAGRYGDHGLYEGKLCRFLHMGTQQNDR